MAKDKRNTMQLAIAMTTRVLRGTPFTPHRFDHLLLREPARRALIIEQDHAEAVEDDRAWLIGRSVEAMARMPAPEPLEVPSDTGTPASLRLTVLDGGRT